MKPWEKKYTPKPWEKHGSTALIDTDPVSVYEKDPLADLSEEDQEAINATIAPEDVELAQATQFYNTRDDTNYPPEVVQAQISYEYGDNATPTEANQKNKKVLEWEKAQHEKMAAYAERTSSIFKSPEIGKMAMQAARLKKEIPARLGVMDPPEAHEFRNQKLTEYEAYVAKLPIEARIEIEKHELTQEYGQLKETWAGRDKEQMPEGVRSRLEEIDSVFGITDSDFEKRVLSGRAKRSIDVFNFSRYSTHKEQMIALDVNADSAKTAQYKIDRLHKMQDSANLTLPEGERFGGKVWYGAIGSAGPMAESIAAMTFTGGVADKAYWALQGQGSVISDYVRESGTKLTDLSAKEYQKLKSISTATGTVYAAIEYIGGLYGIQRYTGTKTAVKNLVGAAMKDEKLYNKLVKGGAKFAWEWLKEISEEGAQGFVTEVGRRAIEGEVDLVESAVEGWKQLKEAAPGTLGITAVMGGVSRASDKRKWEKAVAEYVEKTSPDLIFEYGISEERAKEAATDLANAQNQHETRAILGILQHENDEVRATRKKVLTLGDANRTRKQMSDEEIDQAAESGDITPEQAEAIKAPEQDREQLLDEANDALIELEEPAENVAPPEGVEADPIDLGEEQTASGASIFTDMTNADLAEYMVDMRDMNQEPSPELVAEVNRRFENDTDGSKIFRDRVKAIISAREKQGAPKTGEPLIDEEMINPEIVSDRIAGLTDRAMEQFREAFSFLSKMNGRRSEADLRARAKENATRFDNVTEEQAYNYLKTTQPIERLIRLERELYDLVMASNKKATIELLEKENFKLEGAFAKKILSAIGYLELAEKEHQREKIAKGKQENRVEIKTTQPPAPDSNEITTEEQAKAEAERLGVRFDYFRKIEGREGESMLDIRFTLDLGKQYENNFRYPSFGLEEGETLEDAIARVREKFDFKPEGQTAEESAEYQTSTAPNSGVSLSSLDPGMAAATTVTSLGHLKKQEEYKPAKYESDASASVKLAEKFNKKIDYEAIKASGAEFIVPIDTLEDGGNNAIPYGMAAVISANSGLRVVEVAVTQKKSGLTGAQFKDRISSDHKYVIDPDVDLAGKRILIVDDNYTSGKTVLAVARAVIDAGGVPVMVYTLSSSQSGKQLIPTKEQVTLLLDSLKVDEAQFIKDYRFKPNDLTGSQIKRLVTLNRSKDLRSSVDASLREISENLERSPEAGKENLALAEKPKGNPPISQTPYGENYYGIQGLTVPDPATFVPPPVAPPPVPKSEALQRVESAAKVINEDFTRRSGVTLLEGLTKAQQETALRYAANQTGYSQEENPPAFEDLAPEAQEFFSPDKGWSVLAPEINELLTEAKTALGIDYEGLVGYYFPMKHFADQEAATKTTDDLREASLGSTKHRSGTFDPNRMLSPSEQIHTYIKEVSNLLALARDIAEQRDLVKTNAGEISIALNQEKEGRELGTHEQWLIDKLEELRELEALGIESGLQLSATEDGQVFEWIFDYEDDGGGADPDALFRGRFGNNWIVAVDPARVVAHMDNFDGVTADGRIYGVNTKIYHQNIRLAADKKHNLQDATDAAKESIRFRYGKLNQKNIEKASALLAKVFFGAGRKIAMRARYPRVIAEELGLSMEDAKLVYDFSVRLREAMNKIAMAPDFESDTSRISSDKRNRYFELSRKEQEGGITEEEIDELNRLNPQGKLARTARWAFEKTSITEKDFFGYLFSIESRAQNSDLFSMQYKKIHFWADYLESKGQDANAKWWRNYAEVGIKGEIFNWENKLLESIANLTSKKDSSELDKDIVKANMLEAMNILQRARINAWLGGNLGWSIVTQLGSLTMTGSEAGFRNTARSIFDTVFGKTSFEGSETTRLKSKQHGFKSFEAVGEFQTERVGETKRQKLRNWMSFIASEEEKYLSGISYVAGYRYAKDKLGLNEEQAMLHGDLVAAATQSMYDQYTRNLALGSHTLRAVKPMQSFVFSKFSNIMQLLGKTGRKSSKSDRITRAAKWMIADTVFAYLISMFWGDDPEKAILDPTYSKTGVGSALPLLGNELDAVMSYFLPWQEAEWTQKLPALKFAYSTGRLLEIPVNDEQEHFWRELGYYSLDYITPMAGIPGSVPAKNTIKLTSAELDGGVYRDISGKKSWEFKEKDSPLRWPLGILFGYKAVDETEKQKEKKKDKKGKGSGIGVYD